MSHNDRSASPQQCYHAGVQTNWPFSNDWTGFGAYDMYEKCYMLLPSLANSKRDDRRRRFLDPIGITLLAVIGAIAVGAHVRYVCLSQRQVRVASAFTGLPASRLHLQYIGWPCVSDSLTIIDEQGQRLAGVAVAPRTGIPTGLHLPKRAWAKLNVPPPPTDPAAVEAYGRLFMGRYFGAHDLRLISQSSSPQVDRFEWTDPSGAWYYYGRSGEALSIYRYFERRGSG